jgi:hypothetical protein
LATINKSLLESIKFLIGQSRNDIVLRVDKVMCHTYFFIGRHIVEDEQKGLIRAGYSDETLKYLSKELTRQFGRGFSARNLANMNKFYITYRSRLNHEILQTVSAKCFMLEVIKSCKCNAMQLESIIATASQ